MRRKEEDEDGCVERVEEPHERRVDSGGEVVGERFESWTTGFDRGRLVRGGGSSERGGFDFLGDEVGEDGGVGGSKGVVGAEDEWDGFLKGLGSDSIPDRRRRLEFGDLPFS